MKHAFLWFFWGAVFGYACGVLHQVTRDWRRRDLLAGELKAARAELLEAAEEACFTPEERAELRRQGL